MRISDWSSDVCSSDLIVRVVDPGEVVESLDLEVLGHNAQGTRVDIPAGDGDRKSVVAGKSVSVRVELGGRRIIKKEVLDAEKDTVDMLEDVKKTAIQVD